MNALRGLEEIREKCVYMPEGSKYEFIYNIAEYPDYSI